MAMEVVVDDGKVTIMFPIIQGVNRTGVTVIELRTDVWDILAVVVDMHTQETTCRANFFKSRGCSGGFGSGKVQVQDRNGCGGEKQHAG